MPGLRLAEGTIQPDGLNVAAHLRIAIRGQMPLFDKVHRFLQTHAQLGPVFRGSRFSVRQFDSRGGASQGFAHVFALKLPFWKQSRQRLGRLIREVVAEQFHGAFQAELVSDGRGNVLRISYHERDAQALADGLKRRHASLSGIIRAMKDYSFP